MPEKEVKKNAMSISMEIDVGVQNDLALLVKKINEFQSTMNIICRTYAFARGHKGDFTSQLSPDLKTLTIIKGK